MTSARQLALDLGHRPALGQSDFLVSRSNEDAVAWLDRWPDWPAGGLALWGPPGCGKSHLINVWRARSGARLLAAGDLAAAAPILVEEGARHVALDCGDGGLDQAGERQLLHLYNLLRQEGGTLLLAGRRPPARWAIGLADLRSRLLALPAAEVMAPDDDLIGALLVKLFADRQLAAPVAVIDYLTARMERSFDAARRLVDAIDRDALSRRRRITVPLVAEVLKKF
ncbi:MAG: HdaA/DnaA family protein [Alphaproteobacteria bacterium]